MNSNKYTKYISLTAIIVFLYNLVVWQTFTKKFFHLEQGKEIGDLSRMSYLKGLRFEKNNINNLPKKHTKFEGKIKDIDVLTIGDSFSTGGAGGENPFYQDYIASKYGLKVLNINTVSKGYIETVLSLIDSGMLEKFNPEYIILQSVERTSIKRFSKNIEWNLKANEKEIKNQLLINYDSNIPKYFFFNASNFKAILYNLLYRIDDNAYFSKAYVTNLKKDFFTSKTKNKLLFYYGDLQKVKNVNSSNINKLNNNLNKLSYLLNEKKIKLIFMPVVDKYNLYSEYIIENQRYPKSKFFEELRMKNKNYIFIDTKKILKTLLYKGVKNVYLPDDSHWSNIGSSEVVNNIPF